MPSWMHKGTFVKIAINKYDFFLFSERKQKNIYFRRHVLAECGAPHKGEITYLYILICC